LPVQSRAPHHPNLHSFPTRRSSDLLVIAMVIGPHLVWVADWGEGLGPMLLRLRRPEAVAGNFIAWTRQIALIFAAHAGLIVLVADRKSTRLNSSHDQISYAVFCLKK